MIYFVTNQTKLIESDIYKIITVEESLQLLKDCKVLQFDSETDDLDCHIGNLLSIQFGNKEKGFQIVVDCTTVDVKVYKDILENTLLVGHNLKFDLQWLYNYGTIPLKVYDTMIVEQLSYLGYPYISLLPEEYKEWGYDFPYVESFNMKESLTYYSLSFSLKALVLKYLNQDMDKSVRGNIIYEGLSDAVILYAAHDVELLEDIMWKQVEICRKKGCINGAKLECDVVPAMAYLEWCGIKLDADKWKAKMKSDEENLDKAKKALDDFVVRNNFTQFYKIDNQGDLFSGFCLDPIVTINWSSSRQVVNIAKLLGFDTTVKDKKTGEDKDSVLEKQLKVQKGICDEFLELYFDYQEHAKVVSSFGQGHLNTINPNTGRSHTVYNQLGASSSRMSCGSSKSNKSLAKLNKVPSTECSYPNYQQLPHDAVTRGCFVAEKGNLFCSCDYSSQEGRTQAEIYNERVLIDMYNNNLDSHSVNAKIFFKEELKDIDVKDVKKLRPDLRQAAKAPFFALSYGGDYTTLMSSLGISETEAKSIVTNYQEGYKDTMIYAQKGSKFVRTNGYIEINPKFGHRLNWWDFKKWKKRQESFTSEFWEDYEKYHKGTGDSVHLEVKAHFQAASKYDRLARNAPSQGSSSIMTKLALIDLFKWIVENGYFAKVLIVNVTHDEINTEFPKELQDFYPKLVQDIMSKAGKIICTKVEVPAEASVGDCWIH